MFVAIMMANIVYTTQSYTNAVPVRSFCDLLDMTENFINEFTSIRIIIKSGLSSVIFKLPKRQVENSHPNI
mgnify:CR=1 FL=1